MKTEEFKNVPGLNPDDVIVIKRLNYGERQDVTDKAASVSVVGNKESINISLAQTKLWMLVLAITKAPFFEQCKLEEQKYNAVRGLEQETGDYIYGKVQKLNENKATEELKKKLNLSSKEKPLTQ